MLMAYFDDSGTHGASDVIAVAGYASDKLRWDSFGREWQRMLRRRKSRPIHMTDLENLRKDFSRSKGWDKKRQQDLIQEATRIINKRARMAVGNVVIRADWDKAVPDSVKKMWGGPYGWCAAECMAQISKWSELQKIKDKVHFVFERGTKGYGQLLDTLKEMTNDREINEKYRMNGFSFGDKSIPGLQAADMLVYEFWKETQRQFFNPGKTRPRIPFWLLAGKFDPHSMHFRYWNEEKLKERLEKAAKR